MQISHYAQALATSQTVAITSKAKQLKKEGQDMIILAAGEQDFNTPDNVKEAAISAIREGFTKYTDATGIIELKQAVADTFRRNNGLDYQTDQIVVTNGGKHAIFAALMATINPGDEVLIPAPYWVTYPEVVKLVGAKAVILPAADAAGFKLTPAQLEAAITDKTRMLILNSPSNPTGSVYTREELTGLAAVVKGRDLYVLTDEIYEKIIYDEQEHVSIATLEGIKDQCLVVNGASKAFSMTGWRMGWVAVPPSLGPVMKRIQSQTTHHPCSITQKATLAALTSPQGFMDGWVAEFDERRKYVVNRLNGIEPITCLIPKGAFYVFPSMAECCGKRAGKTVIRNSEDFCNYLLEHLVAVVPGSAFGAENYFRISYAASMDDLTKALDRIEKAVGDLS